MPVASRTPSGSATDIAPWSPAGNLEPTAAVALPAQCWGAPPDVGQREGSRAGEDSHRIRKRPVESAVHRRIVRKSRAVGFARGWPPILPGPRGRTGASRRSLLAPWEHPRQTAAVTTSDRPRRSQSSRRQSAVAEALKACLIHLDGTIRVLEPGDSYRCGRDDGCDIIVRDSLVSRAHCRIDWSPSSWQCTDLDSANGTVLNGESFTGRMALADGDILRLGGQELHFAFLPPGQRPEELRDRLLDDERKCTVELSTSSIREAIAVGDDALGDGDLRGSFSNCDLPQLLCYTALARRNGTLLIDEARCELADGIPRQVYFGERSGLAALRALADCDLRHFVLRDGPPAAEPWAITGSPEAVLVAAFGPDSLAPDPADLQRASAQQRRSMADLADIDDLQIGLAYQGLCGVSGDFYDATTLADGRRLIVLGDVSGHGVQAALVVAGLLRSLRHLARFATDLRRLAADLDADIRGDLFPGQFATATFLAFDPRRRQVEVLLAGHHPAQLLHPDCLPRDLGRTGPGLGLTGLRVDPDRLTTLGYPLPEDATVIVYSDALVEAENAAGVDFASAGLDQALQELAGSADLTDAVERLALRCRDHAGTVDDDLSIIAVRC